jgi:tartrate/fumarate subfamily iron-sulfur-dependent hydro-lyase alpha chain
MTRTSARETFIRHTIDAIREAETKLPSDVREALARAAKAETSERAKELLCAILENIKLAAAAGLPMCQDTGIPIFSLEIGRETSIDFDLNEALATAIQRATDLIPLREHAVDPITRVSSDEPLFDTLYSFCDGDKLSVTVLIKGAGSENVSALAMLEPTQDVTSFVLKTVCESGGKPCPPIIVGLGIGSTFDGSARLAKKTLFRSLDEKENAFEAQMLEQINNLGIGPMGLGGRTTALRVFVEKAPCHTAMLPVAVAIQCWADRKARFRMKL